MNTYAGQDKRYVIAYYVEHENYVTLLQPNQGRFHYDNLAEALAVVENLKPSLGSIPSMMVLQTECWPSGDCCRTVFDLELAQEQKVS